MESELKDREQLPALKKLSEGYEVYYKESCSVEEELLLIEGMSEDARQKKGMSPIESFSFFIRDDKSALVGGIKGATYYGCLYIDSLWIAPANRGRGWGSLLVERAERLGRERNCLFAALTTMDWEALPFYRSLGYEVEFTRVGFEKNSQMSFLRKNLNFDSRPQ